MTTTDKTRELYVLVTNLEYVVLNGVRTFTHALLLCEAEHALGRGELRRQVRGFGTDPAWPTFDLDVPSIDFSPLVPAASRHAFVGSEGPRPLSTGAILKLKDGPEIQLIAADGRRDLDVMTFTGTPDERVILRVWEALPEKVREYWTAPNMPHLAWGRAH